MSLIQLTTATAAEDAIVLKYPDTLFRSDLIRNGQSQRKSSYDAHFVNDRAIDVMSASTATIGHSRSSMPPDKVSTYVQTSTDSYYYYPANNVQHSRTPMASIKRAYEASVQSFTGTNTKTKTQNTASLTQNYGSYY